MLYHETPDLQLLIIKKNTLMRFRQILRALGKTEKGKAKLSALLYENKHKLNNREYWLLKYTYVEQLSRDTVAGKFALSTSHYHNAMNNALTRFETLVGINGLLMTTLLRIADVMTIPKITEIFSDKNNSFLLLP